MKQQNIILFAGFLFFAVVSLLVVLIARRTISPFDSGLQPSQSESLFQDSAIKDKRRIRKVIIDQEEQCLEVEANGVVRTYASCGGELIDINRMFDPKRVIELFEYTSRIDPSKYRIKPAGQSVRLIIETDTGTEIVYIPVASGPDSITDVITYIQGDLPQATATPGPTVLPTPTLPGTTSIPTPTRTPTLPPGITPTSVPQGTPRPFTCGFTEDGTGKRPYNVTNVICSTQPSLAP